MNLWSQLVELIRALDELLRNVAMTDELREQSLRQRKQLSAMLDEVLRQELDERTGTYKAAVEQTNAAVKLAKRAFRETEEREAVIQEITKAAQAIDAALKLTT